MSNQSIIEHRANYYYVEFREDLLIVALNCTYKKPDTAKTKCKASPYCKALILAILEGWTNDKRGRGSDLSVYMTYPQWIDAMYGMFKRMVIMDSLDELIGEGLVSREPHRMYGRDTYKYLLNHRELNKRLRTLPERDPNEKHPQVSWEHPKNDPSISRRVASTNIPVASTSSPDTRLLVDDDPSISRHNIESTKTHNITSTENQRENSQPVQPPAQQPSLSSPSSKKNAAFEVIFTKQEEAIVTAWEEISECAAPRTAKTKVAAKELVRFKATKENLLEVRDYCLRTNGKWYAEHGMDLSTMVSNWSKWQSTKSIANQQRSGVSRTTTPSTTGMDEAEAQAVARDAIEKGKAHGYDIKAHAVCENGVWVVRIDWDGDPLRMRSQVEWDKTFQENYDYDQQQLLKGAK